MPDFQPLQARAREDIESCGQAWNAVLQTEFGNKLDYVIMKGSCVKPWDSPIDYVPVLSDVDIHVKTVDDAPMILSEVSFEQALEISESFEKEFLKRQPEHLHMPRTQLVDVNRLKQLIIYVPPRLENVQILHGNPKQENPPSPDVIREIDRNNMQELEEVLERLPLSTVDRVGFDIWSLVRRICWLVSPTPVRLLSQQHEDPLEVWSWNRTRIAKELKESDRAHIAEHYVGFYRSGWDMFLSDFKSNKAYRSVIHHGYLLLKQCFEEMKLL